VVEADGVMEWCDVDETGKTALCALARQQSEFAEDYFWKTFQCQVDAELVEAALTGDATTSSSFWVEDRHSDDCYRMGLVSSVDALHEDRTNRARLLDHGLLDGRVEVDLEDQVAAFHAWRGILGPFPCQGEPLIENHGLVVEF
jgi:hypothetical protein